MKAIAEYTISAVYDGDSYVIQPSVSSVVIGDSGIYNPSEITFNNKHKQGTGELENYFGRLKIETTSDNTNWTTQYTSSSNEASKVYSLPSATIDKEPYNFRKSPVVSGSKSETIVGGTLGWNQLVDDASAFTITQGQDKTEVVQSNVPYIAGHKYLACCKQSVTLTSITRNTFQYNDGSGHTITGSTNFHLSSGLQAQIFSPSNTTSTGSLSYWCHTPSADVTYDDFMLIDLTLLFGSTIADYIYTLEQSTAGAGVAWVKRYIDLDTYHEYDAGSIQSVEGLVSHDVVGFNCWDEESSEWNDGYIDASGNPASSENYKYSETYARVFPNTTYAFSIYKDSTLSLANRVVYYDANKTFILRSDSMSMSDAVGRYTFTFTTPSDAKYIRLDVPHDFHDICINISDPSRNGTYEPYEKHSYPLDSSVTLRGVPKLDSSNNLYFDGDKYPSNGKLQRKYGVMDLGTLTYTEDTGTPDGVHIFRTSANPFSAVFQGYGVCAKYSLDRTASYTNIKDKCFAFTNSQAYMILRIRDDAYTDVASFKTAMSGVYLVYEKVTPTTETAQPFQSPMIVGTTEEYVSDSIVPVGHESKYTSDIKNIRASLYKAGGTTALLNQITIPVLSQEDFKPKLINTIHQYTKSTSSTSLPSNPTWIDNEEPTIGDNEYMWARLKHVYSDGTFVYSNAVCSTSISGAIHDVDKANKSITDKVWESDITTKINQYDGSTVSTIRDRVSTTETDITGIKSRVSDVESETDDLGTRMTTAETAIEQTANNVVIKATESDTTAAQGGQHLIQSLINVAPSGVTISADKVNIAGDVLFTSGRLSQTSLNNAYAGKGDALSTTEPLYYRSTSSTTPTITTSTSIGTSNNTDNAWTYVMPIPKRNSYFFTCERQVHADGTVTFSTVRALDSQTYTSKWVSSSDQTYIDGGRIYANSITTNQLATDAIKSTNYLAGGTNSPYSSAGTFLDLSNGNFYTPNFGVQSLTGRAYLNGEIIATSGSIGDDSGNYWEIGNTIDAQGNGSASIVGNGTAYIQDGDWQIHSGLSNYSNGSINTQWYTTPQGGGLQLTYPYYDGYYYDYGMTSPVLDTTSGRYYTPTVSQNFLYIRKHASTIPALESDWNYIFRVDKDGMIWINGQSLTQMIQSGVDGGAYVPTSGGTITGNLTVTGTLTATASKANQLTHSISVNGKAFDGSADVTVGTIGAAYGGTGQTSLINSANALLNALTTGSSTPVDADYYISQYVNGGTTTTTYHRRPMSALWTYIKGKITNDHDNLDSLYVKKSGDTMTGSLTVEDSIYADSAQLGDLVVSGSGRFANGLYGNLTGNADTATKAAKVADIGNGTDTTFAYSKSEFTTPDWIAVWNGYELRGMHRNNLLARIGGVSSSNPTFTSEVISQNGGIWIQGGSAAGGDYNRMTLTAGMPTELKFNGAKRGTRLYSNAIAFADPYNGNSNNDSGWIRQVEESANQGYLEIATGDDGTEPIYVRQYNTTNAIRKQITLLDSSGNSTFPGTITASSFSGNATSATTATKFNSARTIQLTGDVTGSASSDGTSGWSISTAVTDNSHNHAPSNIVTGNDYTAGGLDWIGSAKIGSAASNKSFGLPAEAITIEYSTDGGSTWTDYGASDNAKKDLFNEIGNNFLLGKASTQESNTTNCQLRVTIKATDRYVYVRGAYIFVGSRGNTMTMDFDAARMGSQTTFVNIFRDRPLAGNSGPNIQYFSPMVFGGYSGQNDNWYVYRFTFKQPAIYTPATAASAIGDIRLLGDIVWTIPNNMVARNHMYTWDRDFNVSFPAGVTATSFTGNASSASKLNSTRSFTVGKTSKNVDWSGAVSYSKAEISGLAVAATGETTVTANAGWMSGDDKAKLDRINVTSGGEIATKNITVERGLSDTSTTEGLYIIGHANSITAGTISGTATSTLSNGGSFKIPSITYDAYGHITGTAQTTITLPNITSVSSATTATKFNTSRSISLSGDVSGTATSDGSNGWSIATTVADDSHNHTVDTIAPKLTKSYTGIIGTSTSQDDTNLFFLKVVPDSYGGQWFIRYKVLATMDGIATSNGLGRQASYVYMSGMRDTYSSYRIWNDVTNTVYRPFYYHTLYRAREVGISYGHAVGVSLQYSYYPSTTTYKRNITVEIIDYGGCTLSFLDAPVTYSNWTGNGSTNYSGLNRFDGTTQGNTMQGDRNDIYAMGLRNYNTVYFKGGCVAESLAVGDVNGYTQATLGTSFDMAYPILWVTSAKSAGATNYSDIYTQHYDRNIANLKSGFTSSANKVIYLVVTVSGKTATIDSTVVTDTLPSTDDGKVYISIGRMGNNSNGQNYFLFWQNKQMYWYKDGAVRPYVQRAETANTANSATTASSATTATTANYANNLLAHSGNEVTLGANSNISGSSTNDAVWFNYRDIQGGGTGNNSTAITDYYFGNRKGAVTGVEVHAELFTGSLAGNATSATKATQDGSGNTITSYYCTLSTNQTISGTKTFSAMPMNSAGVCVVNSGNGTTGGISLYSDKTITNYGIAMRTTSDSGKHGYVQGDWATYFYMTGANDRGWVFKKDSTIASSISTAGNAVFNGSVTVGGNATNTSGCRQEFDSTLNCLNFIFN